MTIILFIIINFISQFLVVQLFLLVTVQQYEEYNSRTENPVEKFNRISSAFKSSWNMYSGDKGYKVQINQLAKVFMNINIDILKEKTSTLEKTKKYIMHLKLE